MKRIGRYEVVRELRAGGMGSVTLGKSPDGQLVVLKRPHSVDAEAAVRLRDEARIGARLLHPAIVDTLDLFEVEGGVPVLVVAYVDGPSLEVLRPLGPLPMGVIARVGRQIAEGLFALHETCDERGHPLHILHRDVTPGNIVVGRDGDAKLIDLGIARFSERQAEHTQDGFLRGTMRYLAPELLQGDTYSAASDLWALGMVLWEAAVGRFAYRGETDREVLAGILRGEPMELEEGEHVDERLVEVIRPLLHPSPVLRLANGAALAARFAALEAAHGDTEALTRATIADALARKADKDAAQKARLAHMLLPENLIFPGRARDDVDEAAYFADVETAAEVESYTPPPPLGADPFGALPPTEAFSPTDARSPDDVASPCAFEHGEKTVTVPAPVSFLVGAPSPPQVAPPQVAPPEVAPPRPPPVAAPVPVPSDEATSGEDALDATTPMPTLTMPPEALRSDDDDLVERARGFESGEILPPPDIAVRERARDDDDDDEPTMISPAPDAPVSLEPETRARARPAPEPEKPRARRPPSIDDLPAARPKPREALVVVEEELPSLEPIDPEDPDGLLPLLEPIASAEPDELTEPAEPPGAHILELPEPPPPVALPSATFASLFQARQPVAAAADAARPREPAPERAAGEVMKLTDVVALLDEDG